MADFCRHWDINEKTLRGWIDRYERHGAEALTKATEWKRFVTTFGFTTTNDPRNI